MALIGFLAVLTLAVFATVGASPAERHSSRTIPMLLRLPSSSGLVARQTNTCRVGWLACDDGSGCCRVGQYCWTDGDKLGCCPNGRSCRPNDNPCNFIGDRLCEGETFCCPSGHTCLRDASGAPICRNPSGGTSPISASGSGPNGIVTGLPISSSIISQVPSPSSDITSVITNLPSSALDAGAGGGAPGTPTASDFTPPRPSTSTSTSTRVVAGTPISVNTGPTSAPSNSNSNRAQEKTRACSVNVMLGVLSVLLFVATSV